MTFDPLGKILGKPKKDKDSNNNTDTKCWVCGKDLIDISKGNLYQGKCPDKKCASHFGQ